MFAHMWSCDFHIFGGWTVGGVKGPILSPFGQRGSFCILRWLCIVGSKILVAFRRIGLSARLQQVFVDDVAFGKLDRTC